MSAFFHACVFPSGPRRGPNSHFMTIILSGFASSHALPSNKGENAVLLSPYSLGHHSTGLRRTHVCCSGVWMSHIPLPSCVGNAASSSLPPPLTFSSLVDSVLLISHLNVFVRVNRCWILGRPDTMKSDGFDFDDTSDEEPGANASEVVADNVVDKTRRRMLLGNLMVVCSSPYRPVVSSNPLSYSINAIGEAAG